LEAGRVSGALDNLNRPVAEFGKSITQVGAVVDTVSEEVAQPVLSALAPAGGYQS